jgi:hypothetical protein
MVAAAVIRAGGGELDCQQWTCSRGLWLLSLSYREYFDQLATSMDRGSLFVAIHGRFAVTRKQKFSFTIQDDHQVTALYHAARLIKLAFHHYSTPQVHHQLC